MKAVEPDINWKVSPEDFALIDRIVARAASLFRVAGGALNRQQLMMDIVACHNHSFRLRLADWAEAGIDDFLSDVVGLMLNTDRAIGRVVHRFVPRFTEREGAKS
ncbi:MAG: hypothetical protein LBI31_01615 [Zoogloeaceae bacterium]|jgi:hypothetical protein|nr:hypothetical protein [Zoogloeaceae bacterium]